MLILPGIPSSFVRNPTTSAAMITPNENNRNRHRGAPFTAAAIDGNRGSKKLTTRSARRIKNDCCFFSEADSANGAPAAFDASSRSASGKTVPLESDSSTDCASNRWRTSFKFISPLPMRRRFSTIFETQCLRTLPPSQARCKRPSLCFLQLRLSTRPAQVFYLRP